MFAFENFFETADRFRNRHILALIARENFCHVKRLAEKPLNFSRSLNSQLVLRAQFIHSKNSDDVLKIFVSLQYSLHISSDVVMIFPNNLGGEYLRCRCQRIDCRLNSYLGDGPLKEDGRTQVCESVCGRGISEIVSWNIHRLERSDRSFFCRCNSLLQIAHLSSKSRLVPNRTWRSPQQC